MGDFLCPRQACITTTVNTHHCSACSLRVIFRVHQALFRVMVSLPCDSVPVCLLMPPNVGIRQCFLTLRSCSRCSLHAQGSIRAGLEHGFEVRINPAREHSHHAVPQARGPHQIFVHAARRDRSMLCMKPAAIVKWVLALPEHREQPRVNALVVRALQPQLNLQQPQLNFVCCRSECSLLFRCPAVSLSCYPAA